MQEEVRAKVRKAKEEWLMEQFATSFRRNMHNKIKQTISLYRKKITTTALLNYQNQVMLRQKQN